jgi:hypothetical protein
VVIEHGAHRTESIDDWTSLGDEDEDFCYVCDDWAEDDGHGNCKECGVAFKTIDPFISPITAKVYSSSAPKVSSHGDIWGRGGSSGYTWGSGGGWWQGNTGSYTSQWGGGWSSSFDTDRDARLLKHKRHLDSLCKVVDPTVKHTLSYSTSKRNYSNMERGSIFVDGSLLHDNDDKLDVVAGLSIHEKLHLVHTAPLVAWERKYGYDNDLSATKKRLLHNIGNIIEDEFIESQLAKTHAGFVSYIEKVKRHYFEKHGKKIEDCDDAFADIVNTLLALVRYPEVIDADRRKKHAKHLQYFARALKRATESREESLKSVQSCYEYLVQIAEEMAEASKDGDEESLMKRAEDKMAEVMKVWDDAGMSDKLSKEEKEDMLDKMVEDERKLAERHGRTGAERVMEDALPKMASKLVAYEEDLKAISEDLAKRIAELEDSDYSEETYGKEKALGLKTGLKVTWRNQKSSGDERYGRSKVSVYDSGVQEMKSAISGLRRKIDLYGDTKMYTIRNQKRGRLDKKMLHKIPLGRDDLFKNIVIDEDKPLDVCLLVDESGSMGSLKMKHARECAIALREALKDNPALSLWVFGHTADGYEWNEKGATNMSVYWSPQYQTDVKAMGGLQARSENRDGMAILSSAERVRNESNSPSSNKLMIIISDGEPSASQYRGYTAINHTRKVVKHIEGQGWSVIQVGISGAREHTMKDMFKNYIYVDDSSQLANKVSRIIRKVIKV